MSSEESKPITKFDCVHCNVRGWVSNLDKKLWALVLLALGQFIGIIGLVIAVLKKGT